jgi:hypothetical protein
MRISLEDVGGDMEINYAEREKFYVSACAFPVRLITEFLSEMNMATI